jgi:cytochrome P450
MAGAQPTRDPAAAGVTTAATAHSARFDPLDPAVVADPYPAYARLREGAPVHHVAPYDVWMVTRYADVARVVRDPRRFSSRLGMGASFGPGDGAPAPAADGTTGVNYRVTVPGVRVLIATDPPEHQVLRRAVSAAFSSAAVAALEPHVRATARQLVDDLLAAARRGDADLYRDVAEPLPVLVLARMFGVPPEMHGEFREWSLQVTSDLDQSRRVAGLGRGVEMFRYFRTQLRHRRDHPTGDLLSILAEAREVGLSDAELLAFCAFLLVAGIETTTNLLTNLLDALMTFEDQQEALRRDPSGCESAVEEGLRFDSPVQMLWRATTEAASVGSCDLPAGARILVVFGSANRDPAQFDEPDRFDAWRSPNEHLGFGHGPHFCLGARLARLEVRAVLEELLGRTRTIRRRGPQERTPSVILRGFTRQGATVVPAS